ncbi:hypothetical protein [Bordetella bronchialis]|uniref:Type IV pilus biogenesis protein PilP n=1 Tax=Bordetella bronchialis TaxID=463025 RepID=A0A193FWN6_9BORD|nr:hypothetical protein [Bordetella bronchialis]ANN71439.1 hypothetical protein BAU08_08935 [Bordetella bronchialis]
MNANDFPAPPRYLCAPLWRRCAMLLLVAACATPAHAEAPGHVAPAASPAAGGVVAPDWPDTDLVDELLRRETRAAFAAQARRQAARDAAGATNPPPAQADVPTDRIDLAAIYGVGKRLDVEVLFNGRRLRYRHGREWPEEAPNGEGAYALRGIQGSCVVLDGASGNRRICLARGE